MRLLQVLVLAQVLFFSCGSSTGFFGGEKPAPEPGPSSSGDAEAGYLPASSGNSEGDFEPLPTTTGRAEGEPALELTDITLGWRTVSDCAEAGMALETRESRNFDQLLQGKGPFRLDEGNYENIYLQVFGTQCLSTLQTKDVVFIVDVSGSMADNDPVDDTGACERSRAVRRLLDLFGNTVRYSVVTFNHSVRFSSDWDVVASGMDMPQDVGNAICNTSSATNYRAALERAEELFQSSRTEVSKEIYFISDGEPSEPLFYGEEPYDGIAMAAKLKSGSGRAAVRIATLMLNGNDMVMAQHIASKENGRTLHAFAKNASQLVSALEGLIEVAPLSVELDVFGLDASGAPMNKVLEKRRLKAKDFSDEGLFLFGQLNLAEYEQYEELSGIRVKVQVLLEQKEPVTYEDDLIF